MCKTNVNHYSLNLKILLITTKLILTGEYYKIKEDLYTWYVYITYNCHSEWKASAVQAAGG